MWHRDTKCAPLKCCCKSGTNKLVWHRVATNLEYVKNLINTGHNKVKYNNIRYASNSEKYCPQVTKRALARTQPC